MADPRIRTAFHQPLLASDGDGPAPVLTDVDASPGGKAQSARRQRKARAVEAVENGARLGNGGRMEDGSCENACGDRLEEQQGIRRGEQKQVGQPRRTGFGARSATTSGRGKDPVARPAGPQHCERPVRHPHGPPSRSSGLANQSWRWGGESQTGTLRHVETSSNPPG